MSIFAIMGISVVSCALILVVKQSKPELALPLSVAAGCIILTAILTKASPIISEIKSIMNNSGINSEYLLIMLKALGISYLTQFAVDVCNDFGQTALSSKVELCGKIALAAITVPLIISYLDTLDGLIG